MWTPSISTIIFLAPAALAINAFAGLEKHTCDPNYIVLDDYHTIQITCWTESGNKTSTLDLNHCFKLIDSEDDADEKATGPLHLQWEKKYVNSNAAIRDMAQLTTHSNSVVTFITSAMAHVAIGIMRITVETFIVTIVYIPLLGMTILGNLRLTTSPLIWRTRASTLLL